MVFDHLLGRFLRAAQAPMSADLVSRLHQVAKQSGPHFPLENGQIRLASQGWYMSFSARLRKMLSLTQIPGERML